MKTVFLFKIQSYSDVITNSSSELFVINQGEKTKEEIISLLNSIYPEWRTEYEEPVPFNQIKDFELDYIVGCDWSVQDMLNEFIRPYYPNKLEEGVEEFNKYFKTAKYKTDAVKIAQTYNLTPEEFWDEFDIWHAGLHCGVSNWFANLPYLEISEKGRKAVEERYKNDWLLRSTDDNPDFDYQEKLEKIALRIHLG